MRLIKLFDPTGEEIYVNPEYIVSFGTDEGKAYITTIDGRCCILKDTVHELIDLMQANEVRSKYGTS